MRRAFTLIEILIVVVILGILAAAVIPQFTSAADDSRQSAAAIIVKSIQRQVHAEHAKTGTYPATIDATWFEGGILPTNPYFPTAATLFQIVSNNNLHPGNKTDPANGAFWYNTTLGIVRARVQPGVDNNATMARYNAVNASNITALNQTN